MIKSDNSHLQSGNLGLNLRSNAVGGQFHGLPKKLRQPPCMEERISNFKYWYEFSTKERTLRNPINLLEFKSKCRWEYHIVLLNDYIIVHAQTTQ